ncbi:hypothetical protein OPT61_g2609 [Boeremia exigua]|uniref:Uncharacterized protein n=1 Tax=Boeremia exigua TaxID=749465 RepID=A0ACC2IKZ0_9PLEO|nr:hypothetical protein OPT61_g2609 [Boeremia exigua]
MIALADVAQDVYINVWEGSDHRVCLLHDAKAGNVLVCAAAGDGNSHVLGRVAEEREVGSAVCGEADEDLAQAWWQCREGSCASAVDVSHGSKTFRLNREHCNSVFDPVLGGKRCPLLSSKKSVNNGKEQCIREIIGPGQIWKAVLVQAKRFEGLLERAFQGGFPKAYNTFRVFQLLPFLQDCTHCGLAGWTNAHDKAERVMGGATVSNAVAMLVDSYMSQGIGESARQATWKRSGLAESEFGADRPGRDEVPAVLRYFTLSRTATATEECKQSCPQAAASVTKEFISLHSASSLQFSLDLQKGTAHDPLP